MRIFEQHPQIIYNGQVTRNIATRAMVARKVLDKYQVFYPYTIHDGERPDTIASDYYGNPEFDWLVLLCNSMINPYQDWPKDQEAFYSYLRDKYGYVDQLKSQIDHYKYTGENAQRITYKLSPTAFARLDTIGKIGWVPVYLYDHEMNLNEAKREIRLISDHYIPQIERELQVLFK